MLKLTRYLSLLLLAGCFSNSEKEQLVTFQIKTTNTTNEGRPFYTVVKSTDVAKFLTDDYQTIANQSILSKDDPSNIFVDCLLPGDTKTFEVKVPESQMLGVYFIFTRPQEEWKYLVKKDGRKKVKILVGENEIKAINHF